DSVLTVGVYVSPTSPGPTVPPNVNVSVCATGAVFGVVTAAADGPSLLAEVGADVPANAIVKVPSPVSDWMSNWSALFGSATAVTAPLTVTLALIAVTRASRTAVAVAGGAPCHRDRSTVDRDGRSIGARRQGDDLDAFKLAGAIAREDRREGRSRG